MKIHSQNISLSVELFSEINPAKKTLIFLHGFTGSANDWKKTAQLVDNHFNKIAVDLIGHGKSDSPTEPEKYSLSSMNSQLLDIINHFTKEKVILIGYSMGGRAALSFAVNHADKIKGMILESTSSGIEDPAERKKRIKTDEELADFIETNIMETFIDHWMNLEIFGTQKRFSNDLLQKLRMEKLQNSSLGLANSLREFGTGRMPYLGDKLSYLDFPVLLVTGELDSKFTKINKKLVEKFPSAKHQIIKNAGHNVHLEETMRFTETTNSFLYQF
ncbi:MAG: 2-succinyl-6-hydroxy-2,4-cyclohexadiene-1-carboxylate synthase [Ignavibacteria bacterium]|nr:2-succinyl-6-hydroxy-2,4-cyclohexadiene-1-carboxylate synthase [Ignavibacteria bacterium]